MNCKKQYFHRNGFSIVIFLFTLFLWSCGGGGGGGNNTPAGATNVGGGYTLEVSGGTLNDGSGSNGLVVLATLRDSQGFGPTSVWSITLTDPGNNILAVEYNDARLGSYQSWEWANWTPASGTYHASATDGVTTLHYDFTVITSVLPLPAPNANSLGNDITISWPAISGAGSYFYKVCSPDSSCISGMTTGTSEIVTFATLTAGDYTVEVDADTTDLLALYTDHATSPSLAPHENVSTHSFIYPIGSSVNQSDFSLTASGGVLDYDNSGPAGPIYGLSLWASLQDITTKPTPTAPSGSWNISVSDPNGRVLSYIYPAGVQQFAYWYYGIEPVIGTYTVTATYGTTVETATFSLANTTPTLLPLSYTNISSSLVSNATNSTLSDVDITWPAVTNAKSYYVSLWADVWDNAANQWNYEEVWGSWVNATSALVINGEVPSGLLCDVYVDAYAVDMTTTAPPTPSPARVDMSENYWGYEFTMP